MSVPTSVCSQKKDPKKYVNEPDKKYLNDESLDENVNDLLIVGEDNQEMTKDEQEAEIEELLPLDKASLKLYADALNNIMLDPVLAPALPDVPQLSDYAAEIQDVLEWEWTPEPVKGVAAQESGNFLTDFLGNKSSQAGIQMGIGELAKQFIPPVPGS